MAPGDTTPRDTAAKWSPPDSVMESLLQKSDYTVTRYEGEIVTFDALSKAFAIAASSARAAQVEREGQHVKTDTSILYNDQTRKVKVTGHFTIALGGGQAPVSGKGTADYDLVERSGKLTNATVETPDESGQRWFINSEISKMAQGDSARGIPMRIYGLGGSLTSCDDSIPDYHFRLREIKRTEKTLVARPAVLYIRDIPVMWLPFVFQDIRPGRRSGILPPRFGASDIVRNNPGYRRHIENLGYYWALSDYVDFAGWVNWRSSAGADSLDPGWTELNGEMKYAWLSRFMSGRLATAYMRERDGDTRLALSWGHQERFGRHRNLTTSVNYTSSTQLQRRNTFNPMQAMATIASMATYTDRLGPATLSVGGTRKQYPGRSQIDQTLPTLSLTVPTVNVAPWLAWTPSFRYDETANLNIDAPGLFTTQFKPGTNGRLVDTVALKRSSYLRHVTFDSPVTVFGMTFNNGLGITDELHDFPNEIVYYENGDTARKQTRVFRNTYQTNVDWNPTFSLPPLFQNRFKITPSVTLGNTAGGPFWVRSHLSKGEFVSQSKRLTYGLSAAPTIFGIFPGFGPFQRFRHSISPTISYGYAPAARVSGAYLEATGKRREAFDALAQSSVTLGLSQNIEAKVAAAGDTTGDAAQKLKVLSMTFSSFRYDFERARVTGRKLAGITTQDFSTTVRSDLVPGFDVAVDYSLFQGSTESDTAEFSPFLTRIASTLRLSQNENPFTVIARLFSQAVPDRSPSPQTPLGATPEEQSLASQVASQPVAGQAARGSQFVVPPTQGWQATFSFSTSRPRPPRGDRVLQFDPRIRCEQYKDLNPFLYAECIAQPVNINDQLPTATNGAPAIALPRTTSLSSAMNMELTQKWSASWQTSYDFEQHKFATHTVSLQRDLHDWRAIFAFTHSPNGNFAFNFFIALKPQPDLKFDYSRSTMRGS